MTRAAAMAAGAIVLVTNAVVLLQVGRNRAGEPVETVRLTERELQLNYRENEDSGVSVRVNLTRFPPLPDDFSQFDRAKLERLGFDYARAKRDPNHPPLPRPAFVALEYNGPAWEKWLQLNNASPQRLLSSRLLPVDVAATPGPLLQKYPDRQRYLIVEAVVRLAAVHEQHDVEAFIAQILPDSIHVPPPLSYALPGAARINPVGPRYALTLSYGRNFEPWIASVDEPPKN